MPFSQPVIRLASFCLYYGFDSQRETPSVLVLQRGEKYKSVKEKTGAGNPGGHIDLTSWNEQPDEAAVRELREEVVFPNGKPVLPDVTKERLNVFASGIDYAQDSSRRASKNLTMWTAYTCQLTSQEMRLLRQHEMRLATNTFYANTVRQACGQEVHTIFLLAADQLLKEIELGKIVYAHPQGQDMLLKLWTLYPNKLAVPIVKTGGEAPTCLIREADRNPHKRLTLSPESISTYAIL